MRLEEAIHLLNENKHRDRADWYLSGVSAYSIGASEENAVRLTKFEAIAIAGEYSRINAVFEIINRAATTR